MRYALDMPVLCSRASLYICLIDFSDVFEISTEMEYCASAAIMFAEEIWQIAEGFVEVPVNLLVQLKKCGKNIPND